MNSETATLNRSFAALRRLAQRRKQLEVRCELCSAALVADHQHLIEPEARRLICVCQACALLFPNQFDRKYRRIPTGVRALPDFRLTDGQWDALLVPINMAFFFLSSPAQRVVALYPSPAGATESLLELEAWHDIVRSNTVLEIIEPDVEALLVNRLGAAHGQVAAEYYLVPIDKCYELVGLLRANWRGLSGGREVWREIGSFFDSLRGQARCSS